MVRDPVIDYTIPYAGHSTDYDILYHTRVILLIMIILYHTRVILLIMIILPYAGHSTDYDILYHTRVILLIMIYYTIRGSFY